MTDFNFDDLKKTITGAAEVVSKKTGEFVSIQKLKGQIYVLGHSVDKKYQELGAVVFDEYTRGEAINDESAIVCEEISQINVNIAELREELANKYGCRVCPVCEAEVPLEAMFCMKCGAEMPAEENEKDNDCADDSADCECKSKKNPTIEAVKDASKDVGRVAKDASKDVGRVVKDASKGVGKAINQAGKEVGQAVKEANEKVKETVKKGADGIDFDKIKEELKDDFEVGRDQSEEAAEGIAADTTKKATGSDEE